MNRYMIICRLRWPALLILTGVLALLDRAEILHFWDFWPLYLILLGILALAERATLAAEAGGPDGYPYAPGYPANGYPASGYPASGYSSQAVPYPGAAPYSGSAAAPASGFTPVSTEIVPVRTELELRDEKSRADFRSASEEEEGR